MTTTRHKERVLWNQSPGHSKEYRVWVEPAGSGWHVGFAYGRIGSTLKAGRKTEAPVSRGEADSVARALVREKEGRGYQLHVTAPPPAAPQPVAPPPKPPTARTRARPVATAKSAVEITVNRAGRRTVGF
jgi:predicted DNA-binding WGR domain protein